jgi:hypothetical protein
MSESSPLPATFQFSQGKLQDYVDCQRRFQLRYILMQPWPALIVAPADEAERQMQRGADFHRLAHQYALGIDPQCLESSIADPILLDWWRTFLHHPPPDLPGTVRLPEVIVAAPLSGYRLLGKFDLLAVDPSRWVVVDWKTVRRQPSRTVLARRLQTLLYRYLAVEAGAALAGGKVPQPEQVELIYWFAQADGQTERFAYDAQQHTTTRAYLAELIGEIARQRAPIWPLTADQRQCRFCQYRSLCDRGVKAGFLAELEQDLEPDMFEIELEQIAEIEF